MDTPGLGRMLLVAGLLLLVVGGALLLGSRAGLGGLPGDLRLGSGNARVYVPIATSIVISVVATILLNVFLRR